MKEELIEAIDFLTEIDEELEDINKKIEQLKARKKHLELSRVSAANVVECYSK